MNSKVITARRNVLLVICKLQMCAIVMTGGLFVPFHADAARNADKSLGWPGETLAGVPCQGKGQGFGPFDYTNRTYTEAGLYIQHGSKKESPLDFVEGAHFTSNVENLVKGNTGALPIDIDYTLRAFPNHHRALWSMARFQLRFVPKNQSRAAPKIPFPYASGYPPPECYFHRAVKFAPEDMVVQYIYGLYLHRRGLLDQALIHYKKAEQKLSGYSELFYNFGILYLDLNDIENARIYADKAYSLGYPLQGLRDRIRRVLNQ